MLFPTKLFAAISLIALLACPFVAHADGMPGDPCTNLGATEMSTDTQNLIACLGTTDLDGGVCAKSATGKCKWKSMTGGGSWSSGPTNIGVSTGNGEGYWTGSLICPKGQYVCAITGKNQHGYGLIDMRVYCCASGS